MFSLYLKDKMACAVSVLVACVLSIAGVAAMSYFERSYKEIISRQQFTMLTAIAEEIDSKIITAHQELKAFARSIPPHILDNPRLMREFMAARRGIYPLFDNGIFIFSVQGKMLAGDHVEPAMHSFDFSFQEFFKQTVATGEPQISEPFVAMQQHPHVMYTVPLFDGRGRLKGVVGGSQDLLNDNFFGRLVTINIGKKGYLYLYAEDRTLIIHPDRSRIMKKDVPPGANVLFDKAIEGFEGTGETVTSRGVPVLSSFRHLKSAKWIIAANFPRTEVYAPVARAKKYLAAGLVVTVLFSSVAIYLFMSFLTAPLLRLTRHVREITGSEVSLAPAQVVTRDEIGILAKAFNQLLERIDRQKHALQTALAAAEEEKAKSSAILEAIGDGISIHDRSFKIIYQNEIQKRLTGSRVGEYCYRAYMDRCEVCEDCPMAESFRDGKIHRATRQMMSNGDVLDVELTISPLENRAGEIIAAIDVIRDVTERRQVEEALRQSNETLQTVIEAAPLAIVMLDTQKRILIWNAAAQRLVGWSEDEVLGQTIPWVPSEAKEEASRYTARVLAGETLTGLELSRVKKDGAVIDVSLAAAPLCDMQGMVVGMMMIFADITEQKLAEQALRRAKQETEAMMSDLEESNKSLREAIDRANRFAVAAEAASRTKSEFLANMSHEIRTPMNGIIGMTELTLDTELTAEQREYMEMVQFSADALLSLINEILDLSKIEAGKLELMEVDFNLAEVADAALCVLTPQARQKGLAVTCRIDPDVPRLLKGDPARLREILVNLAGNAVKFTERGEVVLSVHLAKPAEDERGKVLLHFALRDTGIGIAPEKTDMIFEAFTQADGSTTRKYGGTGLGLTIVKRVVELMGGRITVESQVGKGSVFHLTIPFLPGKEDPFESIRDDDLSPSAAELEQHRHKSLLLVEDNAVNRIVAARILEKAGYPVMAAGDGKEALSALQRRKFDLVLMDLQMPEMDGLETTRRIRDGIQGVDPRLPVIAMTAHALKGDRERCLAAGMTDYIAKPFSAAALLSIVARHLEGEEEARLLPPAPAAEDTVDVEKALERLGGDEELLKDIWEAFMEEAPRQLHHLKEASEAGNAADALIHIHSLKGAGASIGAVAMQETASRVEHAIRREQLGAASALWPQLAAQLRQVLEALAVLHQEEPARRPGRVGGCRG